jgi:integrase
VTRRRVFGTVRRLPSGRWQARYRAPDGVLLTAPRTFTTKLDANRYLAEIETTQVAGSWRDPRRAEIALRAYAESWIVERTVRGRPLARRTLDTYRNSLDRWILPFLGDEQLGKITAPVVRNWHSRLCEVTGPTARRQAYALLRAILNTAVDDDILHRNPCRVKGAGQPVAPERPLLDLGQVERINDHMPAHLQTLVTVAFWSHTRVGEVIALRRGDVDLEKGTLRIERQQVELAGGGVEVSAPKAGSARTTHLPAPAMKALAIHLEQLGPGLPGAPLFVRPNGSPLRAANVQHAWSKAAVAAGLPGVHFHDLRHAGLTLTAQAGATTAEVMRRAGHLSSRAALIYQHAAEQRDAVIAGLLSAVAAAHAGEPVDGKGTFVAREGGEEPPA